MAESFEPEPTTTVMRGIVPRIEAEPRAREASGRVLIAAERRDALADVLLADGYAVRAAEDEADLARALASWAPDLLIVDGEEPLRSLRPACPVIVIASDDARDAAFGLGASAVFSEPVDVDDLRTAVLNLAATKKAAREISRRSSASAIEDALSRCIFALRDVASERAHSLIGASTLHALRGALDAAESTEAQRRAAEALGEAFARFQDERAQGSAVVARFRLELAALSVLESSDWRG